MTNELVFKRKQMLIYGEKGIILGHVISAKGMEVNKVKVESISKIPTQQ